jgi:hypothetical protein
VRIQKTKEEINQGRTLEQAWSGEVATIQFANTGSQQSTVPPLETSQTATMPPKKETPQKSSSTPATLVSSLIPTIVPLIEKTPMTKTYASLIQYDGPKAKSGITLEAEFIDDGSGSGQAKVVYPGNRYVLDGSWTTLPAGKVEAPKLIDKKALNALRLAADVPLTTSRFADNDTVLECMHGETTSNGQRKGECQDNYGNKYHWVIHP